MHDLSTRMYSLANRSLKVMPPKPLTPALSEWRNISTCCCSSYSLILSSNKTMTDYYQELLRLCVFMKSITGTRVSSNFISMKIVLYPRNSVKKLLNFIFPNHCKYLLIRLGKKDRISCLAPTNLSQLLVLSRNLNLYWFTIKQKLWLSSAIHSQTSLWIVSKN